MINDTEHHVFVRTLLERTVKRKLEMGQDLNRLLYSLGRGNF